MSREKENRAKLEKFSQDLGFSLFGVAVASGMKDEIYLDRKLVEKFNWGISLGKRLIDSVLEDIKDRPTHIYFHHYRQLNFFLDRAAFLLSTYIQELGYSALPIPASQIIDWEKHRGHLSHKKVGELAGLGWIGRSNLLINPKLGARFRLVTVLTDIPLVADKPLDADCGKCLACLKPCPAQAIKERLEDFDHQTCYEKLKEFKRSGVVGQHICGVCVKACRGISRD
jgi:epoxyqueuosine reductase